MIKRDAAEVLADLLCTNHRVREAEIRDSGADKLMLERFWDAMRPHVSHMRGFRPLSDELGAAVCKDVDASVPLDVHVRRVYGKHYEPRLFLTRKAEFLLFVHDIHSHVARCPIKTQYLEGFLAELATNSEFKQPGGEASLPLWLMRRLTEVWEGSLHEEEAALLRKREEFTQGSSALTRVRPILEHP